MGEQYLKEPLDEYKGDGTESGQYMICRREDSENTLWAESIKQLSEDRIAVTADDDRFLTSDILLRSHRNDT